MNNIPSIYTIMMDHLNKTSMTQYIAWSNNPLKYNHIDLDQNQPDNLNMFDNDKQFTFKNYRNINQLRAPAVQFCQNTAIGDMQSAMPRAMPRAMQSAMQSAAICDRHGGEQNKIKKQNINLPVSCGAVLYTTDPHGQLGVILGVERTESYGYLPFKGRPEDNETYEQAAIREVYEETCGLVRVDHIDLCHQFATTHKRYFIGLIKVPYDIIEKFKIKRAQETRIVNMEKIKIKFFPLNQIHNHEIHPLSRLSIKFWRSQILKN